ncbi:hypothetical protein MNBD_ALPHA09-1821 [hydrothermal vent metagenome]|uniref:Uncharacterized protein n=1 Tax=hydrothermal vent metagenome TaxID=652676 RepID=A0A3B0TFR9_9ZZZZ
MTNSRILMIVFGVTALVASFGAAFLALSVFDGNEPAGLATEAQANQPAPSDPPPANSAQTEPPVQTAQAQGQRQPRREGFPNSPGEAANQGGIMSGKGFLKNQHGDWSELCQADTGPGADRCILVQNIESANRPGFGLATVVRKVPGKTGPTAMMHIYVPLGIYLPKGLGLQIDDQLIGNTPFWSCIPFQCEARVTLPPELIAQLGQGQRALYAVYENPTKGTVLPISLDGFAEGLQALKPFVPDAGSSLDAPALPN